MTTSSREAIPSNSFEVWMVGVTPRRLIRSRDCWTWGYGGVVQPGFFQGPVVFSHCVEGPALENKVTECAVGTGSAGVLAICIAADARMKSEL